MPTAITASPIPVINRIVAGERQDRNNKPRQAADATNSVLASDANGGLSNGTRAQIRKAAIFNATDDSQKIRVCGAVRSEYMLAVLRKRPASISALSDKKS